MPTLQPEHERLIAEALRSAAYQNPATRASRCDLSSLGFRATDPSLGWGGSPGHRISSLTLVYCGVGKSRGDTKGLNLLQACYKLNSP